MGIVGVFKNGRRNGQGRLTSINKDEFEGKYVGNVRRGRYKDIHFYSAGYGVNVYAIGQGVWRTTHGDSYDGQWEDDKPSGYGVRYYSVSAAVSTASFFVFADSYLTRNIMQDGSSVAGVWDHGVLVKAES